MGPRHHLSFCAFTTAGLTSELLVSMGPSPLQWFLLTKSVISIRITSLYGSQPSCLVFGCKAATFWPKKQVSMGPSHNLWFYACKTEWLAPELQVSMGLSPRLCFLHAKQGLWTRITSLYGSQTSPVILRMQNSVINTRVTSLYESQPSSVVFGCKTATLGPDLLVSMGSSPHLWFLQEKQRLLDSNNKSLKVPDITCRFVHAIQRD